MSEIIKFVQTVKRRSLKGGSLKRSTHRPKDNIEIYVKRAHLRQAIDQNWSLETQL
jgi:hypothetical protein